MRERKTALNFYKDKPLNYYENLQKVLDARETKIANIYRRKKAVDNYYIRNYQLEYDRIRDLIHNKAIIGDTREMLKNRISRLEQLGAKAIDHIGNFDTNFYKK